MPLINKLRIQLFGRISVIWAPRNSIAVLISSIGKTAQLNTAWKMKNNSVIKIKGPNTGWSKTASKRSLKWSGMTWSNFKFCKIFWTKILSDSVWAIWEATFSSVASLVPVWSALKLRQSRLDKKDLSSSAPSVWMPMLVTTGSPNSWESAAVSIWRPWRFAISSMLSTTRQGNPRRLAAKTKRKLRRKLLALNTQTTKSGRFSPSALPNRTLQVTRSSSDLG